MLSSSSSLCEFDVVLLREGGEVALVERDEEFGAEKERIGRPEAVRGAEGLGLAGQRSMKERQFVRFRKWWIFPGWIGD